MDYCLTLGEDDNYAMRARLEGSGLFPSLHPFRRNGVADRIYPSSSLIVSTTHDGSTKSLLSITTWSLPLCLYFRYQFLRCRGREIQC